MSDGQTCVEPNTEYETTIKVGGTKDDEGNILGGQWKQVPRINNAELFQAEIAPLMVRHVRSEPQVIKSIPVKPVVYRDHFLDMDPTHRAYYQRWQQMFADWWAKMKEEEEGRNVPPGALITKLTYLIGCSSNPHFMLENVASSTDDEFKEWARMIGHYKGPMTAKMLKAQELIKEAKSQGDKCLVFSTRSRNLDLGNMWSAKNGINSMIIDGRVSLKIKKGSNRSQRHEMVEQFRQHDYDVIWAGLACLAEGMNIPEANHGILMDYSWEPADAHQAVGRMIRPQQTKTIYAEHLMHKGTMDDYMGALCYLKGRSHDEGIDIMEFDDFGVKCIPDIHQYADAIVDGTEEIQKREMWSAVEHVKRKMEEEGPDVEKDLD